MCRVQRFPGPPAERTSLRRAGVAGLIAARAGRDGVALSEGTTGRQVTWADLADHLRSWRAVVSSGDIRPGSRVGLRFADPLEMAPSYLAAVAAGLTVAPLDPQGALVELIAAAGHLGLSAVVGGPGETDLSAASLANAGVAAWSAQSGELRAIGSPGAPREPGRGAAALQSSSGTTGRPKLVALDEAQLLHTARTVVDSHGFGPTDVGYSPLPLWHINGMVVGVLASLVGGYRLVVDRRFSASSFWEVVEREAVTWVNLVPAIIAVLAERPPPAHEVSRRVVFARSASAPLPLATLERFERVTGIPVVETYGMTEAASQITANPRPPGERRPGSVGRPVGLELRVVGRDRRPVPAGEIGEVEIRGDNVVRVYWEPAGSTPPERPARNAEGWLPTGDLGRIDPDGYLYLVGRADDVINRGGEKVYPREVEEVLLTDERVSAAAVVGRAHPSLGEEPVAFVLPHTDTEVDPELLAGALARLCEDRLSRFRRPAEIVIASSLPQGTNGKIRRGELRRQLAEAGPRGATG
jgi:acyl-CoA synthetase (AMP-forming)/AMP-acid ligase II